VGVCVALYLDPLDDTHYALCLPYNVNTSRTTVHDPVHSLQDDLAHERCRKSQSIRQTRHILCAVRAMETAAMGVPARSFEAAKSNGHDHEFILF